MDEYDGFTALFVFGIVAVSALLLLSNLHIQGGAEIRQDNEMTLEKEQRINGMLFDVAFPLREYNLDVLKEKREQMLSFSNVTINTRLDSRVILRLE